MQLINHHANNYTFDDTNEASVMNGTIIMSRDEWNDAIAYLLKAYKRAERDYNTYIRDSLSHVFNWTLKKHKPIKRLCLGVVATKLIAYRYGLKSRYKNQNYVIEVK